MKRPNETIKWPVNQNLRPLFNRFQLAVREFFFLSKYSGIYETNALFFFFFCNYPLKCNFWYIFFHFVQPEILFFPWTKTQQQEIKTSIKDTSKNPKLKSIFFFKKKIIFERQNFPYPPQMVLDIKKLCIKNIVVCSFVFSLFCISIFSILLKSFKILLNFFIQLFFSLPIEFSITIIFAIHCVLNKISKWHYLEIFLDFVYLIQLLRKMKITLPAIPSWNLNSCQRWNLLPKTIPIIDDIWYTISTVLFEYHFCIRHCSEIWQKMTNNTTKLPIFNTLSSSLYTKIKYVLYWRSCRTFRFVRYVNVFRGDGIHAWTIQ